MEENSDSDDNEIDGSVDFSSNALNSAVIEMRKVMSKSRKKRKKVVLNIITYLRAVFEQGVNNEDVMTGIAGQIDYITHVIVEALKLLLSLSDQKSKMETVFLVASDFSDVLEILLLKLKEWCEKYQERPPFISMTSVLLTALLKVIAENLETWLYSIVIGSPVAFILWSWGGNEVNAQAWSSSIEPTMRQIGKALIKCGDFSCQYGLSILIQQWLGWIDPQVGKKFVDSMFVMIDPTIRNILMGDEVFDLDYCGRKFLNTLNSVQRSSARIYTVPCLFFFAGQEEMKPPQHPDIEDYWVDFSFKSQRIHTFCSIPGNDWVDLNVRVDQIESVCVSWARRKDNISLSIPQCSDTPSTSSLTNMVVDTLYFIHIKLKEGFENLSQELHQFDGQEILSLVFVFRDIAAMDEIIEKMNLPMHNHDKKQCEKPPKLERLIRGESILTEAISTPGPSSHLHFEVKLEPKCFPQDDSEQLNNSPFEILQNSQLSSENHSISLRCSTPKCPKNSKRLRRPQTPLQISDLSDKEHEHGFSAHDVQILQDKTPIKPKQPTNVLETPRRFHADYSVVKATSITCPSSHLQLGVKLEPKFIPQDRSEQIENFPFECSQRSPHSPSSNHSISLRCSTPKNPRKVRSPQTPLPGRSDKEHEHGFSAHNVQMLQEKTPIKSKKVTNVLETPGGFNADYSSVEATSTPSPNSHLNLQEKLEPNFFPEDDLEKLDNSVFENSQRSHSPSADHSISLRCRTPRRLMHMRPQTPLFGRSYKKNEGLSAHNVQILQEKTPIKSKKVTNVLETPGGFNADYSSVEATSTPSPNSHLNLQEKLELNFFQEDDLEKLDNSVFENSQRSHSPSADHSISLRCSTPRTPRRLMPMRPQTPLPLSGRSDKENEGFSAHDVQILQEKTPIKTKQTLNVLETPGGFYVPESEDEERTSSSEDSTGNDNSKRLNLSTVTEASFMEDPLPRSLRDKNFIDSLNSEISLYSQENDEALMSKSPQKESKKKLKLTKGFAGGRPQKKESKIITEVHVSPNTVNDSVGKSLNPKTITFKQGKATKKKPLKQPKAAPKMVHVPIPLPVRVRNPVPKVLNRTPCYSKTNVDKLNISTDISILGYVPETQFVDPYDFERSWDFTNGKKVKTYERNKRKRKQPIQKSSLILTKKNPENSNNENDSDSSLDAILARLPVKRKITSILPKKKNPKSLPPKALRKDSDSDVSFDAIPIKLPFEEKSTLPKNPVKRKSSNLLEETFDWDNVSFEEVLPKSPMKKKSLNPILDETFDWGQLDAMIDD